MKLTLISHVLCPYVQRAVIALAEKKVPFERIDIDLQNKPVWFRALSPLGKTPVLKVGEHPIFESAVICEYLDDTIEPVLHPTDHLERANHRAWIEFASSTLATIWTFYTAKDEAAYLSAANSLIQKFVQIEGVLNSTGPYFGGKQFALVDAAFAPVFRYFDLFEEVGDITFFANTPKVRLWRQKLSNRPSVQQAVPADYLALLRKFVIRQNGLLARRLSVAV